MRTIKLTVAYDGTAYAGWQRQANGPSIQGLIEDALGRIEGAPVVLHGAGRTDAGVHALAQVAHAALTAGHDGARLRRALNAVLPRDVRVTAVADAPPGFHARFSAIGKVYEYRILNASFASPFLYRYVWHVRPPLDLDRLREASNTLVGTHDFAAFQATGATSRSTERTVTRIDWQHGGVDELLVMRIEGNGFLRHMVRTIVGTVAEVGSGRWPVARVAEALASRNRTRAGPTAPPQGLFLVQVLY